MRSGEIEFYDPINKPDATRFAYYYDKIVKVEIDPSMQDAPLTSMHNMFYGGNSDLQLTSLTTIEGLVNLNTALVTDMSFMFCGCEKLTELFLNSFETKNVTNMESMFDMCRALKTIDVSSFFNTEKVTNMKAMFAECNALEDEGCPTTNFNIKNVNNMSFMFLNCKTLKTINLSNFNTEKVTKMKGLFLGCQSLTSLDLHKFNVAKVENMEYMFMNCKSLTTIYCNEDWNSTAVALTSSTDMFKGCSELKGGKGTAYDENKLDINYARPDLEGQLGYFTFKTSGIENVDASSKRDMATKLIRNGQLLIIHNGKTYNVIGNIVK